MMAFEIENEIKRKTDSWGVSLNFLSALSGVSSTKLSQAFNNARRLGFDDVKTLQRVLRELESLIKACWPLQLRFSNPEVVRGWLEAKRNGELFVIVDDPRGEAPADAVYE
jgi:hypothetical protein